MVICAGHVGGQPTNIDLSRQGKLGSGTSLPGQCTTGQIFLVTSAPQGANLFACAANVWTAVGIPALAGDAGGTPLGVTVRGIQGRSVSASAPADQSVLRWDAASGQWKPAGAADSYDSGAGIAITGSTLAVDDAVVPVYYAGAGAPALACVTGRDLYVDTTAGQFYFCGGAGWQMVSLPGHTHDANALTSGTVAAERLPTTVIFSGQPSLFGAGQRQSMAHNGTSAGLRLVPAAGDPAGALDGDLWYNSTTGKFRRQQGGSATDWDLGGAANLNQANTFAAGSRQSVQHNAANSGFRLVPATGDPSGAADGDVWYNSTTGKFRKQQNGVISDWDTTSGSSIGSVDLGGGALVQEYSNEGATGTAQYQLAIGTGASKQVKSAGAATGGIIGVCLSGCGTSGTAQIGIRGRMTCAFSNATTAWDYVQADPATGKCKDVGAAYPTSGGQIVGQALETGAAGNHEIRFGPEAQASAGGGGGAATMAGTFAPFGLDVGTGAGVTGAANVVYYFRFTPLLNYPLKSMMLGLGAASTATYVAIAVMDASCNKVAGSDVAFHNLTSSNSPQWISYASPLTLTAGAEYYLAMTGDGSWNYWSLNAGVGWLFYTMAPGGTDVPYFTGSNAAAGSGATLSAPASCGARTRVNDLTRPSMLFNTH
jgi:hypothetical protein